MNPTISIKNFSKSFGGTPVIEDVSFEVHEGEIFSFLGANGSGKTTTIRCLFGIYEATQGELLINGQKYSQELSSILGYLPEERGLYTSSKVLETLVYFGELKGMAKRDAEASALKYLERVGLADKAQTRIKQLSSGQQQKIQLGITVLNSPKLLILDEPTKGLDPVNRSLLMDILLELNKEGSTILFSTHQMDEAEKIADRLVMLKNGKVALYGQIDDIKKTFGNNTIHLVFDGNLSTESDLFTAKVDHHTAEITPKAGVSPTQILEYLVLHKIIITKFEVATPSLNEIFIKVSTEQ